MAVDTHKITQYDTLKRLYFQLEQQGANGVMEPFDATGTTVKFRMAAENGDTKQAETEIGVTMINESLGTGFYQWTDANVDTAGTFYVWFTPYDGTGKRATHPSGGRKFRIEIAPAEALTGGPGAPATGGGAFAGTINIWVSSATALTVQKIETGTDYVFQVDTATASAATGIKITGAAAGSGVAIAAISSGTDEGVTFNAKGAGDIAIGSTSTGRIGLGTAPAAVGKMHLRTHADGNIILRDAVDFNGAYSGVALQGLNDALNPRSIIISGLNVRLLQSTTEMLACLSTGDIELKPHSGGKILFGATVQSLGAETVTGYLDAKDSAGNAIKLAVVS